MPSFSSSSQAKLDTCHENLVLLFEEVVKGFDCTVIFGWRSVEEQQALYAQGRTKPGNIVTHKDGVEKRSKHQGADGKKPSFAVDVVPYPIDWQDTERMTYFAGWVMATARRMGIALRWGGDWDQDTEVGDERFRDFPHFELVL
jgi:peptidoglycan L-alanyl-D-glutamate endopeptidase CwlK